MNRILTIYSILLLFCVCNNVQAQDMLNYDSLLSLSAQRLYTCGEAHLKQNQTDTAMGYYIVLAGKYNRQMKEADKYLCAMACVTAGEIYFQKETYPQAFDLYFKGIQISEECHFNSLLARFYKNIGNVYSVFDDNDLAIKCYKKGLEYARETHTTDIEIKILLNLAGICTFEQQIKEAEMYYKQMMAFTPKDSLIEYFGYLSKALIQAANHQNKEAVSSFQAAIKHAERTQLKPKYIASVYTELANLYKQQSNGQDSALYYYEQNVEFCRKHRLIYIQKANLKALAKLYTNRADKNKANFYRTEYFYLTDSILNVDEFKRIKNNQVVYELDKNYRKITTLTQDREQKEAQIRQQRTALWGISGCLFIFISMLAAVYLQKRKLHHAYKGLFQRSNEILHSDQMYKELKNKYEELKKKLPSEVEESKPYASNKMSDQQKEIILDKIMHIMEETDEFCDSDFSLEQLASLIDSNSRYVSQIINETYSKNFRTFINEYRIRKACTRLMNSKEYGNYTIKAIGESVGYKSYANFTDTFKKVTGILPSIYQKLAKEEE